ncbi:phage integrase SAM-like domain-containing protein [Tellurirhabdus rosea]|uniref:phage integrase SAM-like domain-containing protein n=1 Tax=Tellurirhabdus rosea TaxID=2674997 RepID=UPI0022578EB2|nr:phage integrase SAM-like domain-containing protein [Tellurirhabdus rosea]
MYLTYLELRVKFWPRYDQAAENVVYLYGQFHYNNQRSGKFSTGLRLPAEYWNSRTQRAKRPYDWMNAELESIKARLMSAKHRLEALTNEPPTPAELIAEFRGKNVSTIPALIESFLQQRRAIGRKETTVNGYAVKLQNVVKYLVKKKQDKQPAATFKASFMNSLYVWMKQEGFDDTTIKVTFSNFRMVLKYGIVSGILIGSPMLHYTVPDDQETPPKPLSVSQLDTLRSTDFKSEKLTLAIKLFLFQVETGLHYIDAVNLREENLFEGKDGKTYFRIHRQKTGTLAVARLTESALQLAAELHWPIPFPKASDYCSLPRNRTVSL